MNARLITTSEHGTSTLRHAPTVRDAAAMLGVSQSTVRRTAARLGVLSISGDVTGFVRFSSSPVDVSMSYSG